MSRSGFLATFIVGAGLVAAAGISPAHAQLAGQAGATDPTVFNTGGPGQTNSMRPTLVLPQTPDRQAALHPGDGAVAAQGMIVGWSNVNGPYSGPDGQVLATNHLPGDQPSSRMAGK
jgi:hypothetical protein